MSKIFRRVEVNDTFKLYKLITILIIAFITVTTFAMPANAFFFNVSQSWFNSSDEGYFKKIKAPSLWDNPIELKDGRLLFITKEKVTIFNPKTNEFTEKKTLNQDINSYDGILLNNGKVLFAGAILQKFPSELSSEIYLKMKEENSIYYKEYRKFRKQPLEDKLEVYNEYFKKYPELMNQYKTYVKKYNDSMKAQLYNPETNTFDYTGRLNTRHSNFRKTILNDGKIFLMSDFDGDAEIYNPQTGEFSNAKKLAVKYVNKIIKLNNGNIFIVAGNKYTTYNPKTNTYSELKKYDDRGVRVWLKLKDGRLIFFTGGGGYTKSQKIDNLPEELTLGTKMQVYTYESHYFNSMDIKIYDPKTDTIKLAGNLAAPRGILSNFLFNAVVLKDGRVLINGGEKDIEKRKLGGRVKAMKEAEIFDPKTGQSKLISKMNYKRVNHFCKLLNDGRVLIYRDKAVELYIPKRYKK